MTRAYAVVVRRAERNYPADCADVPGCVATGRETRPPVGRAMETSASFEARSAPLPYPTSFATRDLIDAKALLAQLS